MSKAEGGCRELSFQSLGFHLTSSSGSKQGLNALQEEQLFPPCAKDSGQKMPFPLPWCCSLILFVWFLFLRLFLVSQLGHG